MQSCLEKKGIEQRGKLITRNDYSISEEYKATHEDALSNGDVLGKGTGKGSHSHSVPNCDMGPGGMSYTNFDTDSSSIGGAYDIKGRNGIGGREFLMNSSLYNRENQYGLNIIDTSANLTDGQIRIKYD